MCVLGSMQPAWLDRLTVSIMYPALQGVACPDLIASYHWLVSSLVPRLSPRTGKREPGKIGVGVNPWASGGWVLVVPIRLQNDSRDKFTTTASDVAMPLRCDCAKKLL